MDDRIRQTLLYDFYGELLSEHQKAVFSAAVFDDMSYSELADEFNCTRQAAFDIVRRINHKLEGYEEKLGLLSRFETAKNKMNEMTDLVKEMKDMISSKDLDNKTEKELLSGLTSISDLSDEIFDRF